MKPELEVVHIPNPCDQHESGAFRKNPFPFMWYYRTEVRNNTGKPLEVVWFESYFLRSRQWVPANIKGRELTAEDFRQWYADADGPIPPGGIAVCSVNWHGGSRPWSCRTKWAYRAVDADGKEYTAEAEVIARLVRTPKAFLWLAVRVAMVAALIWFILSNAT